MCISTFRSVRWRLCAKRAADEINVANAIDNTSQRRRAANEFQNSHSAGAARDRLSQLSEVSTGAGTTSNS